MRKQIKYIFCFFLGPALLYLFIWRIVPLLYTGYLSLTQWNFLKDTSPSWIGLNNYLILLKDPYFFNSIKTTIYFMGMATTCEVILGVGIALLLDRKLKGIEIIKGVCLIPMLITPVVVGTIWYILFHEKLGPINYFLELIGMVPIQWLNSPKNALFSIVIADIWQWTPFIVLLALAALQTVSTELYEAAKMDGASSIQMFRFITLPGIKNILFIAAVLRAMDSFRVFDTVFIMTGGGPSNATEVASVLVYRNAFKYFDIGYSSALVIVLVGMMSLFAAIYVKALKIGE